MQNITTISDLHKSTINTTNFCSTFYLLSFEKKKPKTKKQTKYCQPNYRMNTELMLLVIGFQTLRALTLVCIKYSKLLHLHSKMS